MTGLDGPSFVQFAKLSGLVPVVGVVFGYIFEYRGVLNTALRGAGLKLLALDWLGSRFLSMGRVGSATAVDFRRPCRLR